MGNETTYRFCLCTEPNGDLGLTGVVSYSSVSSSGDELGERRAEEVEGLTSSNNATLQVLEDLRCEFWRIGDFVLLLLLALPDEEDDDDACVLFRTIEFFVSFAEEF